MNEFNIKNGFISNDNSIVVGSLTATTFYGNGQYLTGINDFYVTGGTFDSGTNTLTLNRQNGFVTVTGFTSGGSGSTSDGNYLPLSGGTIYGNLTVTGNTILNSTTATTLYTDYIDFNTTYSGQTLPVGRLQWDDGNGTLVLGLKGGNSNLELGLENMALCFNAESTTLTAGTIVYVSGSQGNRPAIKRALATNDGYSVTTLGMVSESILSGAEGFVTTYGMVNNLNTNGLTGGTALWLSPTDPGGFTSTKPKGPDHTVLIAYVVRVHPSVGSVFVNISNGWEIDELHDVRLNGRSQGDLLIYSGYNGNNVWTNSKTLTGTYTINGNLTVTGLTTTNLLSASTLTLYTQPNISTSNSQVLTRNSTTGNVEYQNISNFTYLTGGTYYEGDIALTNNLGIPFTVNGTTTYSAGVISGATGWSAVSPTNGQINLPEVKVALYNNANNIEPIRIYTVSSGTTGSGGIPELADNDTNYIIIEYNNGSPRYNVLDNDGTVNDSDVILYLIIYRLNNFVHTLEFGNYGAGLPNKLNDRLIMTDRFGWESGLTLGLSGSTGIVTLSSGVAWNGSYRQILVSVNSENDIFFKNYHSGGTWTYSTTGKTLNNTYYDNGTNIVSGTTDKYLVNWYYRGQEINDHLYEVFSTTQYDDITFAEAATIPELPELITSHAFLVGRIFVKVGETTGITQSAFSDVFLPSGAPGLHNNLSGIQGGIGGEYYHLSSNQYNNIAYKDTSNTFTQTQTFDSNLVITNQPSSGITSTQILMRNSATGQVEITDSTSPAIYNYGITYAMTNFTYLT